LNNNGIKNVEDLRIECHIVAILAKLSFVNSAYSDLVYFISGTERHKETIVTLFVNIF